jgi:predicted dehydrogenase
MGIRIGVAGTGAHAQHYIRLFNAHPLVDQLVLADLIPERAKESAANFGIEKTAESLDELCDMDIDAIAIMTQRQLHGPQALKALKAGKHVYCAVPIGQTVEEIRAIVKTVEETGLIYQTSETSYYYPCTIYCRQRYQQGDFGEVVYGEGQYFHDMSHFYLPFQRSGGKDWKQVAGIPPMHYPTHSTSMMVSVTGAHATSVSCLGWEDHHTDGIFRRGANLWNNIFSNETALMRMSDGSMFRTNEFRRIGCRGPLGSVMMSMYGTRGSFEHHTGSQIWTTNEPEEMEDLTELLRCRQLEVEKPRTDEDITVVQESHTSSSQVHNVKRLPVEFAGLPNGHNGSHQFLADDFCKAVTENKLPPNHVWAAARYCIPGLIAHRSAEQEGKRLDIPDMGEPPENWNLLNPDRN